MSAPLTNLDLFEELFSFIKQNDLNATIKEYGGSNFYIPSYKTTLRNDEIIRYYRANYGQIGLVKRLAKQYDLTERQIYDITREVRETPSLL
ncbi:MAG: Mor transcription activator family protein [Arcobacteraceae bacterium]|nr:Mor transcription activator family protein [Arcobacteraceae bacterium]